MEKEDGNKLLSELSSIIQGFNTGLQRHLPALEQEVNRLMEEQNTNANTIEHYLDTLLSLTMHGIGDKLFVRLLDYYKTIDSEGALYYWEEYDKGE